MIPFKIQTPLYKGLGILILIVLFISFSCCSTKQTQNKNKNKRNKPTVTEKQFKVLTPKNYERVSFGQEVSITLESKDNIQPDSVNASINGNTIYYNSTDNLLNLVFDISNQQYGRTSIRLDFFFSDSLRESHVVKVLHLPNSEPKPLSYKVIRSFPHDSEAYTQGLIYKDGVLYESTGQNQRSSIRAIDPKTGDVIRKKSLEPQYFGEGIAIVNNEIFMLTYRAKIGFVFDLSTFELIRKFNLQTQEGWGLTTRNDTILMSDGNESIYFFNPDNYFTLLGQKEICTNQGLVNSLNELESTPLGLFSNVYGHNYIYLIDIKKGVVTHSLDLSELFPDNVRKDMDHVLNGIAFNPKSNTFYVTGKQWPVMYEIEIMVD